MYRQEIENVVREINSVTDLFYQNKLHEGYKNLEKLLGVLSITLELLSQKDILGSEDTTILDILKEVMGAMEQGDALLVADMLEYELKETLLQLVTTNI